MPCAVAALSSSPIFSPSHRKISPIFCKPASSPPPLTLSPSPLTLKPLRKPFNGKEECLREEDEAASNLAALKRKRPPRINIPVMNMGFDQTPELDLDRLREVEVEGEGYSLYCKRGKRGSAMEDRYSAATSLQGDSKQALFAIYDGHGGASAAEFAAKNLANNIMKEVERRTSEEEGIEAAIKKGYVTTDMEFLKEDLRGGTCCVTALIHQGDLVISNAGDCRAVMSRGGTAEALTDDHRPSREDERERIEQKGGYVDYCHGVWRVHGSLAVSRAIGDGHLKQWVIAEPVSKVLRIKPEYEFLILASDGLWDKVSNQEAVDVVRLLYVGIDKPEPFSACKKLVDLSLSRGSADDISVMVIQLGHFIQ